MKALFRCLALAAIVSALPAWAATSYYYIPAAACRPYSDCSGCVRTVDGNGRGYIALPYIPEDQTILCDMTFPNNASLQSGWGATIFSHAAATSGNLCWRVSPRFVSSGDRLSDLNTGLNAAFNYSNYTQTDVTSSDLNAENVQAFTPQLIAFTQVTANGVSPPYQLTQCSVLALSNDCRGRPGVVAVQNLGSSNCSGRVSSAVAFDQVNISYPTP